MRAKVCVRDSDLVHALQGLCCLRELLSHAVVSGSWEGRVIENLLACAPPTTKASYYRSADPCFPMAGGIEHLPLPDLMDERLALLRQALN